MHLITADEFDRDGGLTIGIGAKNCLYTLRREGNEHRAFHVGDGLPPEIRVVRTSCHIRNLGKDWAEVAEKLPAILAEDGYHEDVRLYVPGHAQGRLDPNKTPDARYIPTDVIPFGLHEGQTIDEVMEDEPDYLYFLAENYRPNEERQRGRWMAYLRERIAPELEARRVAREKEAAEDAARKENTRRRLEPLAAVLTEQSRRPGDFCSAMAQTLRSGTALDELGARPQQIVAEIWAKATGGRRGSTKYDEAIARFEALFVQQPESPGSPLPPLPEPSTQHAPEMGGI